MSEPADVMGAVEFLNKKWIESDVTIFTNRSKENRLGEQEQEQVKVIDLLNEFASLQKPVKEEILIVSGNEIKSGDIFWFDEIRLKWIPKVRKWATQSPGMPMNMLIDELFKDLPSEIVRAAPYISVSDSEIEKEYKFRMNDETPKAVHEVGFEAGAKWMRDEMLKRLAPKE